MTTRPVHFEIHATDVEKAREFYESVFDWKFQQWGDNPYWIVVTGDGDPMAGTPHTTPGIDGGLVPRRGPAADEGQPVNSFVVTVDVPDCAEYVERCTSAGGSVAVPMTATRGVGWLAYVKDPDGNLVGLMQADADAS